MFVRKTAFTFAAVALVAGIVRFFLRMILDPMGVPVFVGSFLASITIVLLIGTLVIFRRAGKDPQGRFLHAAGWFLLLSAWCQVLIVGGILLTGWTEATTYFAGPWDMVRERFPTPAAHAIAHAQGFWVLTAGLMIIGAVTYRIARRRR
jgi:hypothetical protein